MTAGFAGIPGPDDARAYLRDWQARVDQTAADTRSMSDRLGRLRVTAEDDNGLAEVTIDSTGVLIDVRFTERIHRVAPDVVGRAVMAAVRTARVRAAAQARQIITDTVGDESPAGRTIAEQMERQLLDG